MTSIRRYLLAWLGAALLAIGVVAGVLTYWSARAEIDGLLDYQLRAAALSLRLPGLPPAPLWRGETPPHDAELYWQIWDARGDLLFYSLPARPVPLVVREGFLVLKTPEGDWRVYTHVGPLQIIQVAQPLSVRARLAADTAQRILLPTAALIVLLGGVTWSVIGHGLRPLERVRRAIAARAPDSLAPLDARGLPEELTPLIAALNGLLDRLQRALDAQRRFIADAAHELRTPLAALAIQVDNLRRASDEAERRGSVASLEAGIQRAAHLARQLLTLARLEPEGAAGERGEVELRTLVEAAIAELAPLALGKGLDLGAVGLDAVRLHGDAESLRTLVVNLIDNAIRYTPAGGTVDVGLEAQTERAVLLVRDTGPGIPPAEHARVFERFYRCEGVDAPGTGLGLAIVAAIAERHGATIELGEGAHGRGLAVRVGFPRA